MIRVGNVHPLTDFKRDTARFRKRLRSSGEPAILTVDGRAELVVQDAAAYERLLEQVERARAIEGIRRGLDSMERGEGVPLEEFDTAFRRKHGLPKRRTTKKSA
jgi:PHD/YefM family antitoxin component YafN of YafNO toxin-antitoxin module